MNRATAASGLVSAMKDCPGPGCGGRIAKELLVCSWHFQRLPGWIQDEVLRTQGNGPSDPEFRRAAEAALEFLSSPSSARHQSKGAKAA